MKWKLGLYRGYIRDIVFFAAEVYSIRIGPKGFPDTMGVLLYSYMDPLGGVSIKVRRNAVVD